MDSAGWSRILDPERLAAVRATGLLDTPREPAFERLTALAAALLRTPYAFVTLVDDERSFWKSSFGVDSDAPEDRQNRIEESFCQYVLSSGEPLVVNDAAAEPLTRDNPSIESRGVAAWAGFPLVGPTGHVLGTFCVLDTETRQWSENDIRVLDALASAAAGELALRAGAHAADEANAGLSLLAEAGRSLSESLQVEGAAERLVRLVVPQLGDWAVFALAETDGSLRDVAWEHADPEQQDVLTEFCRHHLDGIDPTSATYRAQRTLEPVVIASGATEVGLSSVRSQRARAALQALAPESAGAFPIVARRQRLGVLVICRGAQRPPLSAGERDTARALAARAGLAIDNGRLFDEQLELTTRLREANDRLRRTAARERDLSFALQQAMLPQLTPIAGIDVAARYGAGVRQERVGGDWYDAMLLPDGATLLVVGDVAGHDVAAAAIMGRLHHTLRAFAWDRGEAPGALLTRLDRALGDAPDRLVTAVVARVEPADGASTRTVRWSSAGHPLPVLSGQGAAAQLLDGRTDPPLGMGHQGARSEQQFEIAPDNLLLLYSDGLIQTRTSDIEQRQRELLDTIDAGNTGSSEAVLGRVLDRMSAVDTDDDIVALVAQVG